MENQFRYNGKEALEMIQTHFPNDWQQKIEEGKKTIKSMMKVYRTNAKEAYARFVNSGASIPSVIVMLASLYALLEEDKTKDKTNGERITEILQMQQDYINQAQALENSKATSEIDKRILRQFYSEKQQILKIELDTVTNSLDVVEPYFVVVQTSLFANNNNQQNF